MSVEYGNDPRFDAYYFEDSYVLSIEIGADRVVLYLDAVLTPKSADYSTPRMGEQHCYARARLIFDDISALSYSPNPAPPSRDANGEEDYGNIDIFTIISPAQYHLEGDWGVLSLSANQARVELDARPTET
ncbi:MAG: hypothetical protein ABIS14_14385 [Sphingomonas sp.]